MPNLFRGTSLTCVISVFLFMTACQTQSQTLSDSEVRKTIPNTNQQYTVLRTQETRVSAAGSSSKGGGQSQAYYGTSQNYASNGYYGYGNSGHSHVHSHEHWEPSVIPDYDTWLQSHSYYDNQINEYKDYLTRQLGRSNVPPMGQLLRTARSWQKCGAQPYEVPPRYLWANMVPTLKLYATLKKQGVLPSNTIIRSVYRNYGLNRCAGGARSSKHLENSAIDIYVPGSENDSWMVDDLQEKLCQFWLYQGEKHNFGLGLYATEAIHLDTGKHRKWGTHYTPSYSVCRY